MVTIGAILAGLVAGAGGALTWRRRPAVVPESSDDVSSPAAANPVSPGLRDVFAVLRVGAILVDAADAVVVSSPAATALGLVRGHEVVATELRSLIREVRRGGDIREVDLALPRGPLGQAVLEVSARVAPLGADHVVLLVEDRTQAKRVEQVRRDFVANVSHELKTPVGGIALLAEAVLDASDDPDAVSRFARRIRIESTRLSKLVQEIVELSRLQASDTLSDPVPVDVQAVILQAIERVRTMADARGIALHLGLAPGLVVYGDHNMLVTSIDNLLTNAINYSPDGTRVGIGSRKVGTMVEITVTDQGVGIPDDEQQRIFERFYRVDAARSRATGGTGLGLAIVKHIATNHGGEVVVWSEEGQGSTFTMRLPLATGVPEPPRVSPSTTGAFSTGHPSSAKEALT